MTGTLNRRPLQRSVTDLDWVFKYREGCFSKAYRVTGVVLRVILEIRLPPFPQQI
jgi:hypothetical protein